MSVTDLNDQLKNIDKLNSVLDKWGIPLKKVNNIHKIEYVILKFLASDIFEKMVQFYIRTFYSEDLPYIILNSGIIMVCFPLFYFHLIRRYLYYQSFCNLNQASSLMMLYMFTDSYMDNKDNSQEDKKIYMLKVDKLIEDYDSVIEDGVMGRIRFHMKNILENLPHLKEDIRNLFLSQKESVKQQNKNPTIEECERITRDKAFHTANVVDKIFGIEGAAEMKCTSYFGQLVDDIMDIEEDLEAGIQTLPIKHLKNNTFDQFIADSIIEIGNNLNTNKLFIPIYIMTISNYTCDKNIIGKELFDIFDKYRCFLFSRKIVDISYQKIKEIMQKKIEVKWDD